MKRFVALLLCMILTFTGCSAPALQNKNANNTIETNEVVTEPNNSEFNAINPVEVKNVDDENVLNYIKNSIYLDTIEALDSEDYIVQDVQVKYISKEYIDELEYNSKTNVYFGYTLDELNKMFQGKRYIYTLGDDGKTIVKELEEIQNIDGEKIIKNVLIGQGVILACVTISVVAPAVGAPAAFTTIMTVSAESAMAMSASMAKVSGVSTALATYYKTGDLKYALDEGILAGSEGFKMGAITGAIVGGTAAEVSMLKIGTENGLTVKEVAKIQAQSDYPIDVIKQFHSMDEFKIYKDAGLKPCMVDGKIALVPDINLNYVSMSDGQKITNLGLMKKGKAPIDPVTGKQYQLHHIGQKNDATLAVLNQTQHQGNASILNTNNGEFASEVNHNAFGKVRKEFWEYMGNVVYK